MQCGLFFFIPRDRQSTGENTGQDADLAEPAFHITVLGVYNSRLLGKLCLIPGDAFFAALSLIFPFRKAVFLAPLVLCDGFEQRSPGF